MANNRRPSFEDAPEYPADAYRVRGYDGIACYVRGWETEPDEDTEWSGYENRTGRLIVTMIGDDRRFAVDPEDVTPIDGFDGIACYVRGYCATCGQIGCSHDGRDRSEA